MRPSRVLVQSYVLRHVQMWLLVRGLVSALLLSVSVSAHVLFNPFAMPLSSVGLLILLCLVTNVIEIYRRHEVDFLENLGVTRRAVAAWSLLPPLAGEALLLALRP